MAEALETLDLSNYLKFDIVKESGKITNIKVTEVDIPAIVEHIYERVDPNNNLKDTYIHQQYNILGHDQKILLATQMLITRYCIHRVLTHFKIYQEAAWGYQVGADYYGEEINKIHLKPILANKIANLLEHIRVRNISEKIEVILKMEYGHLIPSVMNKKWQVKQIPSDKLYYSNNDHFNECTADLTKPENASYSKTLESYPYPRAITIMSPDGRYKVIDGYHRLVGAPAGTSPLVIFCTR